MEKAISIWVKLPIVCVLDATCGEAPCGAELSLSEDLVQIVRVLYLMNAVFARHLHASWGSNYTFGQSTRWRNSSVSSIPLRVASISRVRAMILCNHSMP